MKTAFCIFLAFICSLGFSKAVLADSIPTQRRMAIQVAPLALLDFYGSSSYKAGIELRLSKHVYISADAGGYLPNFTAWKNMKGGNLDFRIKYRFPNTYSLISLSYFYKKQSFEYHDAFKEEPDVPVTVYTRKQVSCINMNFEHKFPFLKNERAYFNVFAGLGVRLRDVKSSFTANHDFDRLVEGGDSQSLYLILIPGQKTWINLNFGMRLGFYLF